MKPGVSVVIPVYNEGEAIMPCLDRILRAVTLPCEVLVVYDMPEDTTVPYIEKAAWPTRGCAAVLNTYGPRPGERDPVRLR